jgi:hypothetical protein
MKKIFLLLLLPLFVFGQALDPVVTSFPSLQISSSSRGFAMGDCGIASAKENQQLSYNAAKTAFIQNFHQVAVNYTPWLSSISNDTRFINASYLGNVFNTSALGVVLNYLDMGTITTRDNNGASLAAYHAREYNLGTSYALQLNAKTSLGMGLRFLAQNQFAEIPKNSYSVSSDLSYYQFANIGGDAGQRIEWGVVLSNLGANVNLPRSLGIGIGYAGVGGEDGTQISVGIDIKKLLVPKISASLTDLKISAGIEVGFINQFFLRGGVNLESQLQGNRKFFSLGVGYQGFLKDQGWGLDFHYLVPFGTVAALSPFQNALGFGLHVNMGNFQ